jgi:hypothetical protein
VSEGTEGVRDPDPAEHAEPAIDPWRDGPRWSEEPEQPAAGPVGEAAPAQAAAAPVGAAAPGQEPRSCAWCATPAAPDATTCSSCGAALAQRESIGDLVIPGLTAVDPALQDLADRPLHLTGPSPSHGVASGAIAAAAVGGPAGLAIMGGVAAVAAAEYIGAGRTGPDGVPLDKVGEASEAVRQALEKLERGEALPSAGSTTPRPELEANRAPGGEPATEEDHADGGH